MAALGRLFAFAVRQGNDRGGAADTYIDMIRDEI
jgi:hypothetical protein